MDSASRTSTQSPLSAEQQQQIASARKRARKVRRAVGVAKFDAWTTAVFAAFTLTYVALSPVIAGFDWVALFIGGGMAVVASNSFRGASRLSRYDINAPRLLALNQMLFAALIIAYCLWRIVAAMTSPGLVAQHPELAAPEINDMVTSIYGTDIEGLTRTISLVVYGAVILGSILAQGGMALYYFTRGRHVREFRRQTPPWVVDLLVAGMV